MATAMLRCDVPSEHMSTQCMRVRSVALWCIPHEWRYQTPPSTVHARSHVLRCVASGGSVPEAIVSLDGGVCICSGECASAACVRVCEHASDCRVSAEVWHTPSPWERASVCRCPMLVAASVFA